MKAAQFEAENGEILVGSTTVEQFLSAVQMAELLQLSDNELARLARSAVLTRQRDPHDSRAYIYPAWENVRRYILYVRSRKEGAHTRWLEEKNKTARLERRRAELEMAIKKGKLIDKEQAFEEWAPTFIALRHGFEKLLSVGVSREVVDELLAILQREPCSNGDGAANR